LGINVDVDIPLSHFGFSGSNAVANPEFVTVGGGGLDVFASWNESAGDYSTITQQAIAAEDQAIAGEYACRFETTTIDEFWTGYFGAMYQDIPVSSGASYRLSFASKVGGQGTSDSQGHVSVYDATNSTWLISKQKTGLFSANNWARTSLYFSVPKNTTLIRLWFYQNWATGDVAAGDEYVYYGKVILEKRTVVSRAPVPGWGGSGSLATYRHTISVNIGYDNAQFTTVGSEDYIGDWLENGLGRRVIASYAGSVVWEGFVNEVSARLGASTLTVGPLMGVVNRGSMVYSGVNFSVTPPVTIPGGTLKSQWYDNETSQGKYGVLEGKITGGEGLADEMTQLLQTVVETSSWPEISQNINIGSSGDLTVTVSCLGYGHFLDKFFYSETSIAGFYNADQKILDVLGADPNNIFSAYNVDMEANSLQVESYEDSDRSALAIIKDIVAQGDVSYNRYVFGIYADRKFFYWNATDRPVKYYFSVRTNTITSANRVPLKPWEITPGEWVSIIDIIPGRPAIATNYREDPKYMFIESVTFSSPFTFTMSGGRASTFKQKIEKLGLGGF
jgi:hypothetical protein